MRRACHAGWIALVLVGTGSVSAQSLPAESPRGSSSGLPEVDTSCAAAEKVGGSEEERAALCALYRGAFASARTLVEKALDEEPHSLVGLFVMGKVQHRGEGNLPKALFYLEAARKQGDGSDKISEALHRSIYQSAILVLGEMESLEEQLAWLSDYEAKFDADESGSRAWPLMKLKRYDEARAAVKEGLASPDPWNRVVAKTALCAIESELQRRAKAYEACLSAASVHLYDEGRGAVELSNAGMAADEMLKYDEAERLYLQAGRRPPSSSVNPWGRLLDLYTRTRRWSEALDVLPRMDRYRRSRTESYLDQQDESESTMLRAALALVLGYTDLATEASVRIISRPDRQGLTSAAKEQVQAGAAVFARAAMLAEARRKGIEASLSGWWQGIRLRWEAAQLRRAAWWHGQKAKTVLSNQARLISTLRPELPGSLEMPSWLDFDVIELVGPGVAQWALSKARSLEELEGVEARFLAAEIEIAWLQGRMGAAAQLGKRVMQASGFELEAARAAAYAADAARRLGDVALAKQAYAFAWSRDPGVFVRRSLKFPVLLKSKPEELAEAAKAKLRWSSALTEQPWGFELLIHSSGATLFDENRGTLAAVWLDTNDGSKGTMNAEILAKSIMDRLFKAPISSSQVGVGSLHGMVGAARVSVSEVRKRLAGPSKQRRSQP